jgi:hypothetical protein
LNVVHGYVPLVVVKTGFLCSVCVSFFSLLLAFVLSVLLFTTSDFLLQIALKNFLLVEETKTFSESQTGESNYHTIAATTVSTDRYNKYSQTCIERSPLGQRKGNIIRQVTS